MYFLSCINGFVFKLPLHSAMIIFHILIYLQNRICLFDVLVLTIIVTDVSFFSSTNFLL